MVTNAGFRSSGHGTQVEDVDGDEVGGDDEGQLVMSHQRSLS